MNTIKIHFLGLPGRTGLHLFETPDEYYDRLWKCFQGVKELRQQNWKFPFYRCK